MIYTLPFLPFMMCLPWKRHAYRRKITEVIENIIKELKDALKTDDLIIEECNKILLELSTLAEELFREELKNIKLRINLPL
ncbi:MAG: hypothetical protein NUV45_13085 [Tepidanaerobacteraceae bacterium]|jgi:hypothetical protein|nr:hypothetical protein [Tepidanaerobacteraceae bacterium]